MKVWPIFKKEMRLYFTSPVAWVIMSVFLFIAGYFFYSIFGYYTRVSMQSATVAMGFFFWVYFSQYTRMSMQAMMNPMAARDVNVIEWVLRPLFSGFLSIVLLLSLVPAISMRLIAEERKSQTLELLMTYPVSDTAILLGKFFAGLALYGCMLATSMVYLAILRYFTPLEWAAVGAMYGGLLLMGAAFLAIGLFVSSLTENQIIAALGTFALLLILWAIGWGADATAGSISDILRHVSASDHIDGFTKGVIETRDVIYFVDVTIVFLVFGLLSLQTRRWKG